MDFSWQLLFIWLLICFCYHQKVISFFYIYKRFINLEIGDIEEIGNFSIRVDVNDEHNECIERFEEFVTSKRWHLDSQKNAKEYYTSTKLPQLKVLMLTTLSPAMSFEVNDEQGRD